MSDYITTALQALRDFHEDKTNAGREMAAVVLINAVLADLESYGSYNVLASVMAGFTYVQANPVKAVSYILQASMQGWDQLDVQVAEEKNAKEATKH